MNRHNNDKILESYWLITIANIICILSPFEYPQWVRDNKHPIYKNNNII